MEVVWLFDTGFFAGTVEKTRPHANSEVANIHNHTDVRENPKHLLKYIKTIHRSTIDFNPSC